MKAALRGALLGLVGCVHVAPPTMQPEREIVVATEDGWRLRLRHFPGEGPPVLLVHGLGANHYNWDYREEVSPIPDLQAAGYDVWVPELRGDPGSVGPDRRAAGRFTFDDLVRYDLPAVVDTVLEVTGYEQLAWIGHSLGGMLLFAYLTDHSEQVAAGVAVCSSHVFEAQPGLHRLGGSFRFLVAGKGRIRAKALSRMSLPLGRANPLFGTLAERDQLDWPIAHGLARHALTDLSKPLLHQVAGWVKTGELAALSGQSWVQPADTPLLLLAAGGDRIVAASDVEASCAPYSHCTALRVDADPDVGPYGHIDPIVGRNAREEVYPHLLGFLAEHWPSR